MGGRNELRFVKNEELLQKWEEDIKEKSSIWMWLRLSWRGSASACFGWVDGLFIAIGDRLICEVCVRSVWSLNSNIHKVPKFDNTATVLALSADNSAVMTNYDSIWTRPNSSEISLIHRAKKKREKKEKSVKKKVNVCEVWVRIAEVSLSLEFVCEMIRWNSIFIENRGKKCKIKKKKEKKKNNLLKLCVNGKLSEEKKATSDVEVFYWDHHRPPWASGNGTNVWKWDDESRGWILIEKSSSPYRWSVTSLTKRVPSPCNMNQTRIMTMKV